jgi:hypothetical protein
VPGSLAWRKLGPLHNDEGPVIAIAPRMAASTPKAMGITIHLLQNFADTRACLQITAIRRLPL